MEDMSFGQAFEALDPSNSHNGNQSQQNNEDKKQPKPAPTASAVLPDDTFWKWCMILPASKLPLPSGKTISGALNPSGKLTPQAACSVLA